MWFAVEITVPLLGPAVYNFSGELTAFLPEMQYWQKTPDSTTFFPLVVLLRPDDRALTSLHLAGN